MRDIERGNGAGIAGFAVGVGLVFVATLGVAWHFAAPNAGVAVWGVGSFAIGATLGAAVAVLRRR